MTKIDHDEMATASVHLAGDLLRAKDEPHKRQIIGHATQSVLDATGGDGVAAHMLHGETLMRMSTLLATVARGNLENLINVLACDYPPRPDWMRDPYPLDLSQLDR